MFSQTPGQVPGMTLGNSTGVQGEIKASGELSAPSKSTPDAGPPKSGGIFGRAMRGLPTAKAAGGVTDPKPSFSFNFGASDKSNTAPAPPSTNAPLFGTPITPISTPPTQQPPSFSFFTPEKKST